MVGRILSVLSREIRGLHEAAYVLAAFALLSQVLALIRDRTFAHYFGAGPDLDVYFAAFRIPDLVFAFLTLFVSTFALVPLLAKYDEDERGSLLGSLLSVFGIAAVCVSVVLFFLLPYLTPHLIPGFTSVQEAQTILLGRIMLLQPLLLGLSSIASALVQVSRRFLLLALAPIFYNVGIIVGAVVLYPLIGLEGLAWGVVLGALLHLAIQSIPLVTNPSLVLRRGMNLSELVRDVITPSLPRSMALMANQSLLVAYASLASLAAVGAVSALSFAYNLQSVPLTVIAVSYAAALFPALSALHARDDFEGFQKEVWTTVRHIVFWLLPATALFIVLRAHMVRVVLGSGAFSWDDTRLTAALLAVFAVSLVGQSLILVFSRAYYAAGKTAIPILLNVGGAVVAGVVGYVLVVFVSGFPLLRYFVESLLRVGDVPGTTVLMIPVAYSAVMLLVAFIFACLFARTFGYDRRVGASFGISFCASIIAATAAYFSLQAFGPLLPTNTFLGIFAQGAVAGTVGVLAWLAVLALLKSQELTDVMQVATDALVRRIR
jgi:putative peptidoglycan lipid II flippase